MSIHPIDLDALLDEIKNCRGVEFHGYKRSSLERRLERRMRATGVDQYADYAALIRQRPDEIERLLDALLINVTSFFRDRAAWAFIADRVIPTVLALRAPDAPIRVWSAGCATGEEPYSAALLLAEALGIEQLSRRVRIFATDRDEAALEVARRAHFASTALEDVPTDLYERYFVRAARGATLVDALRHVVTFGHHDLLVDAPLSRIDLLICRNVLMYFNLETQPLVLARLHAGLAEDGVLFLGRSELAPAFSDSFRPVDLGHRVFVRVGDSHPVPVRRPRPLGLRAPLDDRRARPGRLRRSIEQLEIAHEELSAANEQLEATNEELAERNDELAAANEELRATNEELGATVDELCRARDSLSAADGELRQRDGLLYQAGRLLETVLRRRRTALAVVDREQRVRLWSELATEIWGVRAEDAIGHVLDSRVDLPFARLREPIQRALSHAGPAGSSELAIEVFAPARGRIRCRFAIERFEATGLDAAACILMEDLGLSPAGGSEEEADGGRSA